MKANPEKQGLAKNFKKTGAPKQRALEPARLLAFLADCLSHYPLKPNSPKGQQEQHREKKAGGKSADASTGSKETPFRTAAHALPASFLDNENYEELSDSETRTSEIHYRRLFESARDGILILDPKSRKITDANPFMTELLGYDHSELLGKELWQIGLLKDEQASRDAFRDLQKNFYVRYENLPLLSNSGQSHQVEFVSNLYEENGRRVIQCNIRDITERKLAEGQIVEQASFLDKAQEAILVCDLEGEVLFWNKGAERLYGWTRQHAIGRNAGSFLYKTSDAFEEFTKATIAKGEWAGELRHLTKTNGEVIVEARWTLIRDQDGSPKSILEINGDISEKKKIEAHFLRAQRMESLGTLAGGIAHDLNNILTPIMMSIEILKTKSSDSQTKDILKTIEVSAKRGADIVRQVLSFARGLEGERIEIQPKHLVQELENIIKDTFPKNVSLRFSVASDTRTIMGDPTQMHLILLNLCVNARDAMPDGGKLVVSLENCDLDERYAIPNIHGKAGPYVKISITDSGIGMAPELIEKIFEPFFTTKPLHKGTGLGLSTVMAIVRSHNGIINVYSEPGNGTVFNVYLPALATCSEDGKELTVEPPLARGAGETVLIVDDEASILAVSEQILAASGYGVLTAANGADALAIYREHQNEIAVVLTDMMMPIMDGPATIQALMSINPSIKIVAASGLVSNDSVAKASGSGVKHFLAKPFTAGMLLKVMRLILEEPANVHERTKATV